MKFGRNLPQYQVPEWSSSYINYKELKKLIKAAVADTIAGKDADLTGFLYTLDRNLEDVDNFYNKKYFDASRRLRLLQSRYSTTEEALSQLDHNEIEEIMDALMELRDQLRKLAWFGEVNRKGFLKITKKLDKKVPTASTQQKYLDSRVDLKPFATNTALKQDHKFIKEWLATLGRIEARTDVQPNASTHTIKRVSSRAILDVPQGLLEAVDQAVRNNDVPSLEKALMETDFENEDPQMQKLLVSLLQRAISCKTKGCISYFIRELETLDDPDDINERNCLHRLAISIGRAKSPGSSDQSASLGRPDDVRYITPATPRRNSRTTGRFKESKLLNLEDESIKLLAYILEQLETHQRKALGSKDSYGRLPLHYAAQYGIVVMCQLFERYMQTWGQFNTDNGIDGPEWQDNEGLAPLHLSVIGGHALTTKTLLAGNNWQTDSDNKQTVGKSSPKSSAVLALATKSNFKEIVQLMVDAGVDINWQDQTGETALHVAARYGLDECAKILLHGTDDQKVNLELSETSFAWTPLHIACVDGHLSIVELLINAGADMRKQDASGWTAREHAALRGYIAIARTIAAAILESSILEAGPSLIEHKSPAFGSSSVDALRSPNGAVRIPEPVKTFGHRYLTKESMILVSLGTMDMAKNVPAVALDKILLAEAHATQLDTALSIVVSAREAQGDPAVIDLPVQDNISTEPIVFTALDLSKVKLYFDIVPTYSGNKEQIFGRGMAILSSIKPTIGLKRMNLQGDISVPIISKETLEDIGTVNFNFLIITPFSHPNMGVTSKQTYWKEMSSTMVIGHRGLGKNMSFIKSLQLGENTIQSFIAAANLGANYVEFDVQLTKDHVPVIYHDFLVSETGIDAPVHTLTLEQFLHVSGNTPQVSRPPSPNGRPTRGPDRVRSLSQGNILPEVNMSERMKHTRDFKAHGWKANSRGNFIQAPFTTLEEMFFKLPEDVGFNIEFKYPMLFESEEQEMDTYAVELNSFVDTVLTKVYELGKKRKIIFSSFHPDICLLLSFKQPSIPILFLTDAGTIPVGDVRASSLQQAIRFANRWNLLGIVSAAEPFCISPRLVKVVKDSGLVCVSYGLMNNDPVKVQQQVDEGIDAVIVDSVLKIRDGLTKSGKKSSPSSVVDEASNGNKASDAMSI